MDALQHLVPFCSTQLVHVFNILKNKHRNQLDVDPDLRLKVGNNEPDVKANVWNKSRHDFSHLI